MGANESRPPPQGNLNLELGDYDYGVQSTRNNPFSAENSATSSNLPFAPQQSPTPPSRPSMVPQQGLPQGSPQDSPQVNSQQQTPTNAPGQPLNPDSSTQSQEWRNVEAPTTDDLQPAMLKRRSSLLGVTIKHHKPWLICLILLADVGVFLYAIHVNGGIDSLTEFPGLGPDVDTLRKLGAKDVAKIKDEGHWWRLVSPIVLHTGALHLAFNMMFTYRVAIRQEQDWGYMRVGMIYLLSGIAGNLASAAFLPDIITVGASSSLFGMLGAELADIMLNWNVIHHPLREAFALVFMIAINLAIGLLPEIDNFAHVGGLLMGFFCGFDSCSHPEGEMDAKGSFLNRGWRDVRRVLLGNLCAIQRHRPKRTMVQLVRENQRHRSGQRGTYYPLRRQKDSLIFSISIRTARNLRPLEETFFCNNCRDEKVFEETTMFL
eukprot:Rmarinus@m.26438